MGADLVKRIRDNAICDFVAAPHELLSEAAARIETMEAENARQIAERAADNSRLKVQRDNALLDMEEFMNRADAAESALTEAVEVIKRDIAALDEADAQIEYLHEKFKPTGSGVTALTKIDIAATAARAFVQQHEGKK
jgi:Holliday junction resolvasome RuvABC ATP-dependent DNA helicase subunit